MVGDNLLDAEYRDHLSRIKSIMPEAGRSLRVSVQCLCRRFEPRSAPGEAGAPVSVVPLSLRLDVSARIGALCFMLAAGLVSSSSVVAPAVGNAAASADTTVERTEPDSLRVPFVPPTAGRLGSSDGAFQLRGLLLDRDDYLSTTVAAVPFNMPTRPHGLPDSELEPGLPELVGSTYHDNGSYSVGSGDFSSAGSVAVDYRDLVSAPFLVLAGGEDGWRRAVAAGSLERGNHRLTSALALHHEDGPWVHPDDDARFHALVRLSRASPARFVRVSAMGSVNRWNVTNRVPDRAVASGETSRFGAIDPSDGGKSSRFAVSAEYGEGQEASRTAASAFMLAHSATVFANYTYFLGDSVHGDQYEQRDQRYAFGARIWHRQSHPWLRWRLVQTVGADARLDHIPGAGIYRTQSRSRWSTLREDRVMEVSLSPYLDNEVQWMPGFRTRLGVRLDGYYFRVASSYAPFSGDNTTGIISPKGAVQLGPWKGLDLHVAAGYNHNSDDARGASFTSGAIAAVPGLRRAAEHIPAPGAPPVAGTPLLLQTRAVEAGARYSRSASGSVGVTAWNLDIASEHVELGDAVLPAPGRPSRRVGIELTADVHLPRDIHLSLNASRTRARYLDASIRGDHVPGVPEVALFADAGLRRTHGPSVGLHVRHLGPRSLTESDSVRSSASWILDAEAGFATRSAWTISLAVVNVLDRVADEESYFYVSRLPGEPTAGVAGLHSHPEIPRSLRLVVTRGLLGAE